MDVKIFSRFDYYQDTWYYSEASRIIHILEYVVVLFYFGRISSLLRDSRRVSNLLVGLALCAVRTVCGVLHIAFPSFLPLTMELLLISEFT